MIRYIWSKGLAVVREFWWFILSVSVALEVVPLFMRTSGSNAGLSIVLSAYLAYFMHRLVLFDEPVNAKPDTLKAKNYSGRFLGVTLLFVLLIAAVTALVYWKLILPGLWTLDEAALLLIIPSYGILLALFGTMLPETAATGRVRPFAALGNARQTFVPILLGLMAGPMIVGIGAIGATILLQQAGIPIETVGADGKFDPLGAVFSLAIRFLGFVATAMAVVVLCNVYEKTDPVGSKGLTS